MNFLGSDCSSASTPESNGSASNGFSSELGCADGSGLGLSPAPSSDLDFGAGNGASGA